MKTATGTRENVKVIEEFTSGGLKVEVLEYEKLLGLSNASMAQQIYFMEQQHIHVRQIALYLNNEKVTIERGAMSYFQGNIEMVSGVTCLLYTSFLPHPSQVRSILWKVLHFLWTGLPSVLFVN